MPIRQDKSFVRTYLARSPAPQKREGRGGRKRREEVAGVAVPEYRPGPGSPRPETFFPASLPGFFRIVSGFFPGNFFSGIFFAVIFFWAKLFRTFSGPLKPPGFSFQSGRTRRTSRSGRIGCSGRSGNGPVRSTRRTGPGTEPVQGLPAYSRPGHCPPVSPRHGGAYRYPFRYGLFCQNNDFKPHFPGPSFFGPQRHRKGRISCRMEDCPAWRKILLAAR